MFDLSNYWISIAGIVVFVAGRAWRAWARREEVDTEFARLVAEFAWLFDFVAFAFIVGGFCAGIFADETERVAEALGAARFRF